jgi:hypothetical protein
LKIKHNPFIFDCVYVILHKPLFEKEVNTMGVIATHLTAICFFNTVLVVVAAAV